MIADLLISTHLDDAVWSASGVISEDTVLVTICAGIPEEGVPPHPWGDTQAGFTSGQQAMLTRRVEDVEAGKLLGFTPVHMDVLDAAYGGEVDMEAAVEEALSHYKGGIVVGPMGLDHLDHNRIAEAFLMAAATGKYDQAWVYEDQPYAKLTRNRRQLRYRRRRLNEVEASHPSLSRKEPAVRAYKTQIRPSTHMKEILGAERYWKL